MRRRWPTSDRFDLLRRRLVYSVARGSSAARALFLVAGRHGLSLADADHDLGRPRGWAP